MNRRGLGDKVHVVAFLFLIVVIGIGVAAGVFIFFGSGYDARAVEADLLNYKIRKCIMGDSLLEGFFEKEIFFDKCKLNKKIVEENNLIRVCENANEDECIRVLEGVIDVGSNFEVCRFEGTKQNDNYPKCAIKSLEKIDGEGKVRKFVVITGSNQFSRRVLG